MKLAVKKCAIFLLILVIVVGVSACDGKPDIYVPDFDPDTYEPNVEGRIKFTYSLAENNEAQTMSADSFVEAFMDKYSNVTVDKDYTGNIPAKISSGSIGDVFFFNEVSAYDYAVTQNALMPLSAYLTPFKIDIGDVYKGIYQLGMINGELYYVSRDYNHMMFVYNKSAVIEANLTNEIKADWTWEQFQNYVVQLTKKNDDGTVSQVGAKMDLGYSPIYTTFLEAYVDSEYWCDTEEKKITFIDPNGLVLQGIREALALARDGYIHAGTVPDSMASSYANLNDHNYVFSATVYPSIHNIGQKYDTAGIQWDFINFPNFEHPSIGCGSSGLGVYNRTSNPDTAAALALFLYTPEGQEGMHGQRGGSVPLLESMKDSTSWRYPNDEEWKDKNWDAFVYNALEASTVGQVACRMPNAVATLLDTTFKTVIKNALNNEASLDSGLAQLETQCNQLWERIAAASE